MDFSKTDEQELLLESIDEFFSQHPEFDESYIQECERKHEPLTAFREAMLDCGLGVLGIPEEFGGVPVDTLTFCMAAERINQHGFPSGFGTVLQINDILAYGTPPQQADVMECLMSNRMAFCLGLTEPGAGSDGNALSTSYERKEGKVVINGHKSFITDGDRAKYMLCLTRDFSIDAKPNKSMTTWLVPMDAKGITIEPLSKLGQGTRSLTEIYLDNVEVTEDHMVGEEHNGFMVIMKNFEIERLVIAADSMGMASCAYQHALQYATNREQFGKTIGSFQLVQEMLMEMRIKVDNMRNLVYRAAWELDQGIPSNATTAMTKYHCSRTALEVIDTAMQVLGGLGYTSESSISRLWRDVRMNRFAGGTDQIMVHIAGRALQKEIRA